MVHYRRNRVEGGTFFFTVAIHNRNDCWLTDCVDDLRSSYRKAQEQRPFITDAIVILPDHIHAVWTLPEGDSDYSGRWRLIKARFSHALLRSGRMGRAASSRDLKLWQSRFWEHTIRDEDDFSRHVDYTHFNPVKHGHVHSVKDWPHSSFHRYVRRGDLPADWGGGQVDEMEDFSFGE